MNEWNSYDIRLTKHRGIENDSVKNKVDICHEFCNIFKKLKYIMPSNIFPLQKYEEKINSGSERTYIYTEDFFHVAGPFWDLSNGVSIINKLMKAVSHRCLENS